MARQIESGGGRNSGLIHPALLAACQTAITPHREIQPPLRLAPGTKPPPRNFTGRLPVVLSACGGSGVARSSILNLAFGVDCLGADQRPQFALQRRKLAARLTPAALAARHRDG